MNDDKKTYVIEFDADTVDSHINEMLEILKSRQEKEPDTDHYAAVNYKLQVRLVARPMRAPKVMTIDSDLPPILKSGEAIMVFGTSEHGVFEGFLTPADSYKGEAMS